MSISEEQRLSSSFLRDEFCVLGLPFDRVDEQQALEVLDDSIRHGKQCFLSTPNLNFAISALSDADFRESVFRSDLSVADGMPLIWLSRLIGMPLPERVAGSTLFDLIRHRTSSNPVSVFFFGGMENVAELAAEELNRSSPGAKSVGGLNPGIGSIEDMSSDEIIRSLNAANPDFLVVSLGAKKGQRWILQNQKRLNARVISHLGAVVNFVAGTVKRAPPIWQKLGLEWVWRIVEEPGLWKRYFFDGLQFLKLVVTRVIPLAIYGRALRRKFPDQAFEYSVHLVGGTAKLIVSGSALQSNLLALKKDLPKIVLDHNDLTLDLRGLKYADSSFWALLIRLRTELSARGGSLLVEGAPSRIARLARLNLVDGAGS